MAIAAEKRAALLVEKKEKEKEEEDLKAASGSGSASTSSRSRPMLTSEALLNTVLNI